MTSISQRFQTLRSRQQCAFIPFITAGDPDLETTAEALRVLDRNGADAIELGVPYSDPLADGPVIQAAATRALEKGVNLKQVLKLIESVSPELQAPIILFTYYNPILNLGIKPFLEQISAAGVRGLVVPDLPVDESAELLEMAASVGVEVILLVAPTSSEKRIANIAQKAQGFIYLVSVTGVTGMRSQVQGRVKDLLEQMHSSTDKPICVGFGISGSAQARQVKDWGADGVIVGSAFVKLLTQDNPAEGLKAIESLCRELKDAIAPVEQKQIVSA